MIDEEKLVVFEENGVTKLKIGNSPALAYTKNDIKILVRGDDELAGTEEYLTLYQPVKKLISFKTEEGIITKERQNKGDIITGEPCEICEATGRDEFRKTCLPCHGRGWIGTVNAANVPISDVKFAQVQVKNILNRLWEINAITEEMHDAVHTYEAWQNQHRVAMGLMRASSNDDPQQEKKIKLRAHGFILLIRRLSLQDKKAIDYSLQVIPLHNVDFILARAIADQRIYRGAFERLVKAFAPIREHITQLEGLSQDDLDMLSEVRLKKSLEEIIRRC